MKWVKWSAKGAEIKLRLVASVQIQICVRPASYRLSSYAHIRPCRQSLRIPTALRSRNYDHPAVSQSLRVRGRHWISNVAVRSQLTEATAAAAPLPLTCLLTVMGRVWSLSVGQVDPITYYHRRPAGDPDISPPSHIKRFRTSFPRAHRWTRTGQLQY